MYKVLSIAVKSLLLGTAYAAWTGIGAVSIAVIGNLFFHEPIDFARIACIELILAGVIGLKAC